MIADPTEVVSQDGTPIAVWLGVVEQLRSVGMPVAKRPMPSPFSVPAEPDREATVEPTPAPAV